jgi:enamine deaminase RidA (YjgF/YER057c/UK114 family)
MSIPQEHLQMAAPQANGPVEVMVSRFAGSTGAGEFNLMLRPLAAGSLEEQLDWLEQALAAALADQGLARGDIVFSRFLCADPAGELDALSERARSVTGPGAVSVIVQPPVAPALVVLWAYCIEGAARAGAGDDAGYCLRRGDVEHHWSTSLCCPSEDGAHGQTLDVLDRYERRLVARGMKLQEHCLRTWLFVRDVDRDYGDLVAARNEVFESRGLTPETHYIASTGIQGGIAGRDALVALDAYAVKGLSLFQVRHLKAPAYLSDTHIYGVRFERATQVAYRDRKHVLVSGTASIDASGAVVHRGDVRRQLQRALKNVSALLLQAGATLADMQYFIAYVRNPEDAALVHGLLGKRIDTRPFLVVTAPVCRPDWLVEVEGIAITENDDDSLPAF